VQLVIEPARRSHLQQSAMHQRGLMYCLAVSEIAVVEPPRVVRLLSDPVRWRLLRELAASDRRVRELVELVGEPQNLVSYHLRQLRAAGLVEARRSSFDGRDTYYRMDPEACTHAWAAAGAALHPSLGVAGDEPLQPAASRVARSRVLFLCTGNSARSPMAAALLEQRGGNVAQAVSAGSHPKPRHPNATRVLAEYGITLRHEPTHLDAFREQSFDVVISLCDRVREVCPEFPGHPTTLHWSVPDPSLEGNSDAATLPAFRRTAAELDSRIRFLLHALAANEVSRPAGRKRRTV
jgi:protein-tyrosine-phosphatase/DNA-binding transcriptional ArsR family regulator